MIFFNNRAIGLDIDDRSLEAVVLAKRGQRAKLLNFSRQALPAGLIANGLIQKSNQLKVYLEQLFYRAKPRSIAFGPLAVSLPASQCYQLVVTAPWPAAALNQARLRQIFSNNLPLAASEMIIRHRILQSDAKSSLLAITAANRLAVRNWQNFFHNLKWPVTLLDNEFFAMSRDLVYADPKQPVCLVDVGSIKTNIVIIQSGAVYYDNSLAWGGHFLTKAIAAHFKLTLVTAERKKLQLGLNRQIFPVVADRLQELVRAIGAATAYYQDHYNAAVKEAVLVGGSSRLRGLVDFCQEHLSLPVSVGKIKSLNESLPVEYYPAIGLAWRLLNRKKFAAEPDFAGPVSEAGGVIMAAGEPGEKTNPATPVVAETDNDAVEPVMAVAKPGQNPADDLADNRAAAVAAKILARQKIVLLAVLLIGLLLLPAAFWYRQQNRDKLAVKISQYSGSLGQLQSMIFKIPVVVNDNKIPPGAIKGRIVESVIPVGARYDLALPEAFNQARGKLIKGETLWMEPLNEIVNEGVLKTPLVLRWLAYDKTDAVKASLARVDELNQDKIDYSFNNLEVVSVEKTSQLSQLILQVKLDISAAEKLTTPSATSTPDWQQLSNLKVDSGLTATATAPLPPAATTTAPSNANEVLIKPTETGWLNIRAGPGLQFPTIRQIDDGGRYPLVDGQGNWLKIKLPDGQSGWGAARYMQKL